VMRCVLSDNWICLAYCLTAESYPNRRLPHGGSYSRRSVPSSSPALLIAWLRALVVPSCRPKAAARTRSVHLDPCRRRGRRYHPGPRADGRLDGSAAFSRHSRPPRLPMPNQSGGASLPLSLLSRSTTSPRPSGCSSQSLQQRTDRSHVAAAVGSGQPSGLQRPGDRRTRG
jgi:hypothetical protein